MIYCVDSDIIIWGIKKQASPGQEENIQRAETVFALADSYSDQIVIPAVALAEILVHETPTARARYIEVISKSFIIAPFDTRAAMIYAEIMQERLNLAGEFTDISGAARQKMKADHLIIATAIANNCNAIYSTDPGMRRFAPGYIDIRDLPPLTIQVLPSGRSTQQELFQITTPQSEKEDDEESPF